MLSFNVRSIVEERLVLADTMLLKDFDVICLTETWLVSQTQEKELHLRKHKLFRADHSTKNYKTKHVGVLIGLAEVPRS